MRRVGREDVYDYDPPDAFELSHVKSYPAGSPSDTAVQ
jgi:hypothetical protein